MYSNSYSVHNQKKYRKLMQNKKEPVRLHGRVGGSLGVKIHSTIFMDRKCAIKFLPLSFKGSYPDYYLPLKRDLYFESTLLKDLSHPHIVNLYNPTIRGKLIDPYGIPFIAHFTILEMLEGGDLLSYGKRNPLSEDEIRYYFVQILEAVQYLHSKGVAHQDIKSDNIVLDGSLITAKLVDFGYAVQADRMGIGTIRGTKEYIAPEVISMVPHDPKKVDIFALGVTLHTLATGAFPCCEMCTQGDAVYKLLCEKKFEEFWTRTAKSELSVEFKDLVQAMLHPSLYYRPMIDKIKEHPWVKKPLLPAEIITKSMKERWYNKG